MSVEVDQLLDIAGQVLGIMGVHDYNELRLTYVNRIDDEWQVNVSFVSGGTFVRRTACFAVNAVSEEIRAMFLDRAWR